LGYIIDKEAFEIGILLINQLPDQIIHGDWHMSNTIFDSNHQIVGVVDYDDVRFGKAVEDVAYTLTIELDNFNDNFHIDTDYFLAFLNGYFGKSNTNVDLLRKLVKADTYLLIGGNSNCAQKIWNRYLELDRTILEYFNK